MAIVIISMVSVRIEAHKEREALAAAISEMAVEAQLPPP